MLSRINMITEDRDHDDDETPNGWPLGLENMNTRLRVADRLPAAVPRPLHVPSSSFSSFSSSNLDTESTASFFQDNSVSLGRLIGIKPSDRGNLYFRNTIRFQPRHQDNIPDLRSRSHGRAMEMSRGICVPQLLNIIVKRSKSSKSHSRQ